jgi:arylsulfatase A-like enzyme/Flp pilus assembly protein TadD
MRGLSRPIGGLVLLAVALVIAAAVALRWRSAPERASILLITIDTLRIDRVSAYGSPIVPTAALDTLAAGGTRFTAAYATVPLTLPAHVSILSGRLPVEHSVRTNDGYRVPDGVRMVAEDMQAAGYRTAAIVGSAVLRRDTGIARGFERFDDNVGAAGARRAADVVSAASAWLATVGTQPFFLWVHLFDPHLPYDPPEPFASQYPDRPYDGEVAYTDAAIGQLLTRLDEAGLAARTHVIAAADHGEGLGDHGERSHGVLLYDTTIRVPLLVRFADRSTPQVVDRPVSTSQIASTIRELAGLPPMEATAGLMASSSGDPVVTETLYTAQQLGWSPLYAVRAGSLKLIDAPRPELYDVARDPGEHSDLAASRPEQVRGLRSRLRGGLETAARRASESMAAPIDPAAKARLAALGYVSGGAVVRGIPAITAVDPKTRMDVWQDIERALELEASGRRAQSAEVFAAVLAKDPENVLASKFLGALALEQGDLKRAIELNEKVAASGLHLADALSNLALAYLRSGRFADARERARLAVEQDPDSPAARANLVLVLQEIGIRNARAGRTDSAIAAFREAATVDPDNLDAMERLAALLHRSGRNAEARTLFESVASRAPARPAPQLSLAMLDMEAGRPREAIARLQRIRDGWPGAYRAECYLGEAFLSIDDRVRSREAYAACAAKAPPGDPMADVARRALSRAKEEAVP